MLKKRRLYILALLISSTFSASGATNKSNEIKLSFIGDSESLAFMGINKVWLKPMLKGCLSARNTL